jgi:hypothetical protein
VQLYRPEEFAKQIELKSDNAWGIAATVVKRLMQLPAADPADADPAPAAKYLMLRDPNKPLVRPALAMTALAMTALVMISSAMMPLAMATLVMTTFPAFDQYLTSI